MVAFRTNQKLICACPLLLSVFISSQFAFHINHAELGPRRLF